jgi:hypothetical protein
VNFNTVLFKHFISQNTILFSRILNLKYLRYVCTKFTLKNHKISWIRKHNLSLAFLLKMSSLWESGNKENAYLSFKARSINQKEIRSEKMPFATVNLHRNFLCGAESTVVFNGRPDAGGDVGRSEWPAAAPRQARHPPGPRASK